MMERISKNNYYLDIAKSVSRRSNCLKRQYGVVIVKNDEIIATGYNGSPRGCENCSDIGKCKRINKPHNSGDYSDCHSVHAEQNAMLSASRNEMIDSTMYLYGSESFGEDIIDYGFHKTSFKDIINPEPCPICARMILNSGIEKLVTISGEYTKDDIANKLI